VHVVSAGVHDRNLDPGVVLHTDLARVGESRLLLDGKSVHVGADEDGGALAVLHHGDDSEAADFFRHVVPQRSKARGELGRRLFLPG
jgi:hypothetical protein